MNFKFDVDEVISKGYTTRENLDIIREWNINSGLPVLPDHLLVMMLISKQNSINRTKIGIVGYFKNTYNDQWGTFRNRDVDSKELVDARSIGYGGVIFTEDNDAICFAKLKTKDSTYFDTVGLEKMMFMTIGFANNRKYPPRKAKVVLDADGFGLSHLLKIKIAHTKRNADYAAEGMPLRIEEVHIINSFYFAYKFFALLKPWIKSEFIHIMKFHPSNTDMKEFAEKHIPYKYLPKDYGGEQPYLEEIMAKNIDELRGLKPFFEAEEELRKKYNPKKVNL